MISIKNSGLSGKNVVLLIVFLLCLISSGTHAQEWEYLENTVEMGIMDIEFNSAGVVFAGTYENGAYRSFDNGYTWEQINNGLEMSYVFVIVVNSSDEIYAGGSEGMYFSDNGGDSWTFMGLSKFVESIAINSMGDLFAGTKYDGVFRLLSGDDSWIKITDSSIDSNYIRSIAINSNDDIFFSPKEMGMYRSTDNGESWVPVGHDYSLNHNRIVINSEDAIYAGQYYWIGEYDTSTVLGGVFRSTDNGETWVEWNTGFYHGSLGWVNTHKLRINRFDEIVMSGEGAGVTKGVFRLSDNGEYWEPIGNLHSGTTLSIDNSNNIFAGSNSINAPPIQVKGIYRWDGSFLDVSDNENLPAGFSLHQNYPNPFNPSTRIEFELPRRCDVDVTILNILGQKVRTLVNQELSMGAHVFKWDGCDDDGNIVSSGFYYCRLKAGDRVETKKMVLLK